MDEIPNAADRIERRPRPALTQKERDTYLPAAVFGLAPENLIKGR